MYLPIVAREGAEGSFFLGGFALGENRVSPLSLAEERTWLIAARSLIGTRGSLPSSFAPMVLRSFFSLCSSHGLLSLPANHQQTYKRIESTVGRNIEDVRWNKWENVDSREEQMRTNERIDPDVHSIHETFWYFAHARNHSLLVLYRELTQYRTTSLSLRLFPFSHSTFRVVHKLPIRNKFYEKSGRREKMNERYYLNYDLCKVAVLQHF